MFPRLLSQRRTTHDEEDCYRFDAERGNKLLQFCSGTIIRLRNPIAPHLINPSIIQTPNLHLPCTIAPPVLQRHPP